MSYILYSLPVVHARGAVVQTLLLICSQEFMSPVSEPLSCCPSHCLLFSSLSLPASNRLCDSPTEFLVHFFFHGWKLTLLLQIHLTSYSLLSAHLRIFWHPTLMSYNAMIPMSDVLQDRFCCLSWLLDSHSGPLLPVVTERASFIYFFFYFCRLLPLGILRGWKF